MTDRDDTVRGRCLCGACTITAAAPFSVTWCHCADCRRATGAPAVVFVGFRDDDLRFAAAPAAFRSSPPVTRLFCDRCGTPIGYRDDRLAGETWLYAGVLDAPERFVPTTHAFEAERLPWVRLDDGLPRHPRFTRARG